MYTLLLAASLGAPPPPDNMLPPAYRQPGEVRPPTTPKHHPAYDNAELQKFLAHAQRTGIAVEVPGTCDGRECTYVARPDGLIDRRWGRTAEATPVATAPVAPAYVPTPPREVRAPAPFRAPNVGLECEYDPDHICNRCGRVQLVIDHWNRDGTHTHVCANPRCRHSWRHRG